MPTARGYMRPPGAFENNVAFATFLRASREYDLALMLVWEGRSGDHRFSGPNLRKFAAYHGADRILAGMVIVEGFGPEGIAVWRLEVTAHPEAYLNVLAGTATALRQSAERKRKAFARFGRILPTEELDPDDGDPEGA